MSERAEILVVGYAEYMTPDEFGRDKRLIGWMMGPADVGFDLGRIEIGGWTFDQLVSIHHYAQAHGQEAARRLANQHRTGVLPLP